MAWLLIVSRTVRPRVGRLASPPVCGSRGERGRCVSWVCFGNGGSDLRHHLFRPGGRRAVELRRLGALELRRRGAVAVDARGLVRSPVRLVRRVLGQSASSGRAVILDVSWCRSARVDGARGVGGG
eukprot:scaffold15499_cov56-Phaeocystis_antarctica.AAC.2